MLGQLCDIGSELIDPDLNDSDLNDLDDDTTTCGSLLLDTSERSQPPTWFGSQRPAFSGVDR